jgi:hypothetical protein
VADKIFYEVLTACNGCGIIITEAGNSLAVGFRICSEVTPKSICRFLTLIFVYLSG